MPNDFAHTSRVCCCWFLVGIRYYYFVDTQPVSKGAYALGASAIAVTNGSEEIQMFIPKHPNATITGDILPAFHNSYTTPE